MKKYLIFVVEISLLAGSLALINSVKADTEPVTADINKDELRQSLSITEIPGRLGKTMCLFLDCPQANSSSKPSNEVLMKAAKVIEIGTNLLKVSIFGYAYKIDLAGSKIVRQWWGESDIDEFSVGDVVNVWGYLDAGDNYLVHAKTVRDVSIQKIHGVFKGTIESINSTDKTFVLKTEERGNQTVIISDSTKIITATTTGSFSDLQVTMPVVVRGLWNKTLSKIQAQVVIVGISADVRPFFQLQKNSSLIQKIEEKLKSLKGH
jgi:hypothetical protein